MDGVSITTRYNPAAARNIVWTYAAGASDNSGYLHKSRKCGCPCTDFANTENLNVEVLGKGVDAWYYCNTAHHQVTVPPKGWIHSERTLSSVCCDGCVCVRERGGGGGGEGGDWGA